MQPVTYGNWEVSVHIIEALRLVMIIDESTFTHLELLSQFDPTDRAYWRLSVCYDLICHRLFLIGI